MTGYHPWLQTKTQRGRLAVEAASRWIASGYVSGETGAAEDSLGDCAAECMAHDILALTAARKWIKPYSGQSSDRYALRVA
jgi:hypothetical protein